MIDTIVLFLNMDKFTITKPEKFHPHAGWVLNAIKRGVPKVYAKQNPTKRELKEGSYKPRLTLSSLMCNGTFEPHLKIELSLPKLFFGNNFNELRYKDFNALAKKLHIVLEQMGIQISMETLALCPISAIHYAKNIPLVDGSTPYYFINKIKEANVKFTLDTNQTNYRDEGHCYKWHCNAYEVVFYDKIKDLQKAQKSEKRALEKDNMLQVNLFKTFKKRKKKFEVLRMEVRLNKRQKIKQLFSKLNIKSNLTFKKLFKPALSRKVLLHYLDELESRRLLLLDYKPCNDKELLATLIVNNPQLSPKQIFQTFGFKKALETMNPRELRHLFAHCSARGWYRLIADIKKVNLPATYASLAAIRENLEKFKPL